MHAWSAYLKGKKYYSIQREKQIAIKNYRENQNTENYMIVKILKFKE